MSSTTNSLTPRIIGVQAVPYELPLVQDLDLGGGHTIRDRQGILVRVALGESAEEAYGWGDVAPLPGFSPETTEEVTRSTKRCARALQDVRVCIDDDPLKTLSMVAARVSKNQPASVRFGFEQALATSIAAYRRTTLPELLSAQTTEVQLNALLTGTVDEMRRRAEAIDTGRGGYRSVKVKVGRGNLRDEARLVQNLHDRWGKTVSLRLDANRAWSFDEAMQFARAIEGVALEYLEEPLQHPRELSRFADETGVPVALDETTRELPVDRWLDEHYASAFVIKPMLIGFKATLELHRRLATVPSDNNQPTLVISSAYESGVGLAGLAVLAASVQRPGAAAGLDTYRALDRDVLADRLPMDRPSIDVEDWTRRVAGAPLNSELLGPSLDL